MQVDLDPARKGNRYPLDVGLVGDSARTLQALLPLLNRNADRSFLETAQAGMRAWWALMEKRGTATVTPMNPQVVAWELGKRLSSTAMVSCDSGTIATWFARRIPSSGGSFTPYPVIWRAWVRVALRDRGPGRLPESAIGCLRGRWRLYDVDGRNRDCCQV